FFKNFGLTVVAAVLMSLAVARMITPMIAAYFLKAKGHQEHGGGWLMDLYMKVLAWSLDTRVAQAMRARLAPVPSSMVTGLVETVFVLAVLGALVGGGYGAVKLAGLIELPKAADVPVILIGALAGAWLAIVILNAAIGALGGAIAEYHEFFRGRVRARLRDHRLWCFGIGVGALGLTLAMFYLLPMQFQPLTDSDSSRANIEMVPGTTIEQTEEVTDRVAEILSQQPEVRLVMERVSEGSATLFIMLKPDRQNTSIEFERRLNKEFQTIPDARVTFSSQSGGGGTGRDVSVMLAGSDPKLLQDAAQTLVEQMKGVKGVVAPRIAADLQRPELVIVPRLDLAAQLGVTTSVLSQTIRIATMGEIDQNAAKFSLSDRQVPIRVILPKDSRRDISTIENLPVTTASGGSVPLKRVAEITFGAGPTQIQRYNQSRRIFVGADLAEGALKGPVMEQVNKLPIMKNLPAGVSNNAVGDDKWQAELIQNFITAVVSGILLVFGVLVLLYRRFVSPLVNMTSLLLAPLGGLLALALLGQPISISVYIGLLMLLGIVAKNSILLIDFAIEEMERGESKQEAILEAGHKRAQPIVMTTMAMTAGMVPTALSLSGDAAWRAPMGTTVIGGLILSTLLTLLIVPAGFSLADGFEKRLGPWLRRNMLTYRPGDDHRDRSRPEALPAE
ncbi:MAG TPA: efflux RND transporter permease subunit, partial [Sphingomonadaceae bacterium]|nr:efflux RND transporter permease subunit [Sphingomonadaceae bacterium]